MTSIRESIFAANDITSEKVEVKEWGVTVEVRSMTALERTRTQSAAADSDGKIDMAIVTSEVVIASVFDPATGLPVFEKSDRANILAKNGAVIERLAQKAMSMSGMESEAVDKAGASFPETARKAAAV